jgi:hypothetical protein
MGAMKNILRLPLVLVACLVAFPVWSQSTLDGHWRVTFATEGAEGREATVELKGGTGTWTTYARSDKDKKDPCVGRPLPLSIAGDPAAGKLDLRLDASSAIAGCRDRKATLQRTDDKTLEGSFDNGRAIKLVRQ